MLIIESIAGIGMILRWYMIFLFLYFRFCSQHFLLSHPVSRVLLSRVLWKIYHSFDFIYYYYYYYCCVAKWTYRKCITYDRIICCTKLISIWFVLCCVVLYDCTMSTKLKTTFGMFSFKLNNGKILLILLAPRFTRINIRKTLAVNTT